MSPLYRVLRALLLSGALFMSFLALIARADDLDEASRGKVTDWIILGPLWAGTTFMYVSIWLRGHPRRVVLALGASAAVWVIAASLASWWEGEKMEIRMRNVRKHRQEHPLPTPGA